MIAARGGRLTSVEPSSELGFTEFAQVRQAHLDSLPEQSYTSCRMSTRMTGSDRTELLQGTLDLLILRTLLLAPAHGQAIAKSIEMNSEDVLQVEQGSLYPALHRLIKRGWISVAEGTSEHNRRAKYY